jgi:hypothetical protein
MTRGRVLILVTVLALAATVSGVALAGSSLPWTPRAMRAGLLKPKVRLFGILHSPTPGLRDPSNFLDVRIKRVSSCKGLGARKSGGYALFKCGITWTVTATSDAPPTTGSYWTSPWSKRTRSAAAPLVCVTDVSRGTCPPPPPRHPLPGDPRKCGNVPTCIGELAGVAARQGQTVYNESCVAGAVWTTYNCTWNGGGATVKFVQGKTRWTTRVTG